ncbi:MAG: hypothetical protein O9340_13575 [Cyclobacteriaceae bacterium]|nr:hypothetical protein [Cyclobacteriaceae bacterium]
MDKDKLPINDHDQIIYLQGYKSMFEKSILLMLSLKMLFDLVIFYLLNKSMMDLIFFSTVWIAFALWITIYYRIVLKRKILELKILQIESLLKLKLTTENVITNELENMNRKIQVNVKQTFKWKLKLLALLFLSGLATSVLFCFMSSPILL